jgi:hypothetical protein
MIEVCAGGLSTYSRCISVPLCSRPPKISLGKVLAWIIHDFASKKRKGALKD